uniref:Uncharacterized protein n=1 Tax=Sphaerodactylus townsendi TaxID=933632 RepID=A0ACB8F872_9SAUR
MPAGSLSGQALDITASLPRPGSQRRPVVGTGPIGSMKTLPIKKALRRPISPRLPEKSSEIASNHLALFCRTSQKRGHSGGSALQMPVPGGRWEGVKALRVTGGALIISKADADETERWTVEVHRTSRNFGTGLLLHTALKMAMFLAIKHD